jgi:hypothetical protein
MAVKLKAIDTDTGREKDLEGQFIFGVVDKPANPQGDIQIIALGVDGLDSIMKAVATGTSSFILDVAKEDEEMKQVLAAQFVSIMLSALKIDINDKNLVEREDLLNGKD